MRVIMTSRSLMWELEPCELPDEQSGWFPTWKVGWCMRVTVVSKQASTQSKASIQASLGYPAVNSFLKQETPGGWRNSWESGNSAHGKAVCCSAALSHFPHHTKNHATDSTKMLQSSSLPIQCCEVHLGFLSNPIFIHLKFLAISECVFIAILI